MATAKIVEPTGPQHYLWWFPGSPVKVHLALHVVQQLKNRILETGPASEEGLLFGKIQNGATEILGFESSAHENVASLVGRLLPERSGSLVGYYRTENGEAFQLNARDHALAGECFSRPFSVFLIIHRKRLGPPTATFFFQDRDCRMAEFAFLEFPFDPSLLAAEQFGRMQRTLQANEGPTAIGAPAPVTPIHEPAVAAPTAAARPKRNLIRQTMVWTALLTAAVGTGILLNDGALHQRYLYLKNVIGNWLVTSRAPASDSAPSAPRPSMSLRAIRQNGDLTLTWNRDSALIANARSGALSITDGGTTRVVPFDATQLRDGSLLYSPKTDQILMQLTVSTPTDTYTESVTVILQNGKEPRTEPVLLAKTPSNPIAVTHATPAPDTTARSFKLFTAPVSQKAAPRPVPNLQDPPSLNAASVAQPSLPAALAAARGSVERPPSPTPPVAPARTAPPSVPPVAGTYEPALAIVKTQPKIPPELRPVMIKRMAVEVHVTIDKTGKVVHAEGFPQRNISQLLINSAVDASLTWKFKPAMHNHEPVASESILEFVFNP